MLIHFQDAALLPLVSRIIVAAGWAWFTVFFVFRLARGGSAGVKRERVSSLGIALQMLAFALVWMLQRPLPRAGTPLAALEIARDVLAPVFGLASVWFGLSAVRTLGKQWSYEARVIEGHELVTSGPYAWVRHPIYTAMLGKLLASNFAFGAWLGLPIAGTILVVGTLIRIGAEEKLLRATFGAAYDEYARRVPAFVPGPR
jgi:protein-S-isoprenylcysteine O-methyltransferase Ste14